MSDRVWPGAIRRSMVLWALLAALMIALLAGCGETISEEGGLPPLRPTVTPVPPTTPTPVPQAAVIALPPVDWDALEPFQVAMRAGFEGDIAATAPGANRYYIEASLSFEAGVAIARGAERVRYTNRASTALEDIVFRLYPNMTGSGGRMQVYSVEIDGAAIETRLAERDTVLIVPLPEPLAPGASAELVLQFSTAAERGMYAGYGMYGFHSDTFSGAEWYPMLSVYEEGSGWWTTRPVTWGDALYSETSLFEVKLTVPQNFVLAFSGSALETIANGDGTKTVHYVSGPMRTSMLVASPYYGVISDTVDDIAVNVYFWPGGESAAEQALDIAVKTVSINNATYGPYPFAELDVVETFVFTAMEHPGLVTVAERWWERGNQGLEYGTVHEIGHQWFYSLVGNNQVEHPWIDESLTVYTEFNYTRAVYGERGERDWLQSYRDRYNFYRSSGAPDLVLNLPVSAYADNNYGAIIYGKGPLFYVELEKLLGTETFLQGLRLYFERFRYKVATSYDILSSFEEVSGLDLDAFFYQWVGPFEGLDPAVIGASQSS